MSIEVEHPPWLGQQHLLFSQDSMDMFQGMLMGFHNYHGDRSGGGGVSIWSYWARIDVLAKCHRF
jgi:hypothetical protein